MRRLNRDETESIKRRIGPLMPLVARMKQRLEERGYNQNHHLYRAISAAYDALRGLCSRIGARFRSRSRPASRLGSGTRQHPSS